MMKLQYLLLGSAVLLLASCSQDVETPSVAAEGEGNFTLEVKLPAEYSTRVINDGLTATNLWMAVYDADNDNSLVFQAQESFNGQISTNVNLNLVTKKSYTIALFATSETLNAPGNVYDFDAAAQTLTMNYANMDPERMSADLYDCFYGTVDTGVISSGMTTLSVTLYRPIAQINWGTSDLGEDAVNDDNSFGSNGQYINTTLTTEAYTTLGLLTGIAGTPLQVTMTGFNAPSGLNFPVGEGQGENGANLYDYVAMQYLLAPSQQSTFYELTLTIDNAENTNAALINNKIQVVNAPVQANFQTNIYGALLTDNTSFTVKKDPNWTNSYDWSNDPVIPSTNADNAYVMSSQGNFTWLAQQVAEGKTFEGENFVMEGDVYFIAPATPIGYYSGDNSKPFSGNFDGGGYTIYNLQIPGSTMVNGAVVQGTGLFGYSTYEVDQNGGYNTITNVKINGVEINSTANATGALIGYAGRTNVSRIYLSGAVSITSNQNNVGGVIGYIFSGELSDIYVTADSGSTVTGNTNVGGVVGEPGSGVSLINSLESNLNVKGFSCVGGVLGRVQADTFTYPSPNTITVEGCIASGNIEANGYNANAYTVGGVCGTWVNISGQSIYFTSCDYKGSSIKSGYLPSDFDYTNYEIVGASLNTDAVGSLYIGGTLVEDHYNPWTN